LVEEGFGRWMSTVFGDRPLVNGSRQLDVGDGRFRGAAGTVAVWITRWLSFFAAPRTATGWLSDYIACVNERLSIESSEVRHYRKLFFKCICPFSQGEATKGLA
jgi:hypothetical protein